MCYHGDLAHAQAVSTRPSPLVYRALERGKNIMCMCNDNKISQKYKYNIQNISRNTPQVFNFPRNAPCTVLV